jgi:hypothetical protein
MKKIFFFLAMLGLAVCLAMCSKKNNDDNANPTPTCSDGIQNQGETGIDCGGPCTACQTQLCNGNGSGSYFPLANNNRWVYDFQFTSYSTCDTMWTQTTASYGGKTYYKIQNWDAPSGYYLPYYYYFREDASHNIYTWTGSADVLYLPANPTMGQVIGTSLELFGGVSAGRAVDSVSTTFTSPRCTYNNCLRIKYYNTSSGFVYGYAYYVKGIGLVRGVGSQQLKSVSLY